MYYLIIDVNMSCFMATHSGRSYSKSTGKTMEEICTVQSTIVQLFQALMED